MSRVDASNIHALLNYLVSNATLTGKVGRGHILVPLTSLLEGQDDEAPAETEDIMLKVSIEVDWRAAEDVDLEEEYNVELTDVQELEFDEQSETESRSTDATNKNKKGH